MPKSMKTRSVILVSGCGVVMPSAADDEGDHGREREVDVERRIRERRFNVVLGLGFTFSWGAEFLNGGRRR
ncbi:hypothetical protein L6164_014243 [Bauhinia variegata]|uniref:Uncharacterized protein n=1 Tax=Bauhinia variegata TaxID=167791 RepID=A0ACB9NHL2_BAUVA|nr:hypothetical protein L6164_014243 [Bauhinia variegata]